MFQGLCLVEISRRRFGSFGCEIESIWNGWFRSQQLYGDTVIQLALQLAYQRLYQKPAATYETAATRRFYHGRTETMRSCTVEAQNFVLAMLDDPLDGTAKRQQRLEAFAG